jgi:hypothetical protein
VVDPLATGVDPVDLAALRGAVAPADGDGAARELAFSQDGPSHYTAPLPAATRAQVDVLDLRADGGAAQRTLLAIPYPAEDVPQPAEASVLGALAQLTRGRLLPADDPRALAPGDGTALWPFLVALALALVVAAAAADARRV